MAKTPVKFKSPPNQKGWKVKSPSPKGPKMGAAGNSNSPKKAPSVTFEEKAPKPGRFTSAGSQGPSPKPSASTGAKGSSVTFPKEEPSTRFTDKLKQGPRMTAKTAAAAESFGSKALRVGLKVSKVAGIVGAIASPIADAKPTNVGESEWLKNKGPLMKGPTRKPGAPMKPAPSSNYAPKTKPFNSSPGNYRGPNRGISTAGLRGPDGVSSNTSSGMSFNGGTATGAKAMGMSFNGAAPASSTASPGLSKGSYTELAYKPTGTAEKRVGNKVTSTTAPALKTGGNQSRYQRDSGLAMDSRKKK